MFPLVWGVKVLVWKIGKMWWKENGGNGELHELNDAGFADEGKDCVLKKIQENITIKKKNNNSSHWHLSVYLSDVNSGSSQWVRPFDSSHHMNQLFWLTIGSFVISFLNQTEVVIFWSEIIILISETVSQSLTLIAVNNLHQQILSIIPIHSQIHDSPFKLLRRCKDISNGAFLLNYTSRVTALPAFTNKMKKGGKTHTSALSAYCKRADSKNRLFYKRHITSTSSIQCTQGVNLTFSYMDCFFLFSLKLQKDKSKVLTLNIIKFKFSQSEWSTQKPRLTQITNNIKRQKTKIKWQKKASV